jgi:hypothetical protein
MISENLYGDCLYLLTCHFERHAILVMPLQLGQNPQLVCVIPRVTFSLIIFIIRLIKYQVPWLIKVVKV